MEEFEVDVYDWPGGNTIGKAIVKPTDEPNVFIAEIRMEAPTRRGWAIVPVLEPTVPQNREKDPVAYVKIRNPKISVDEWDPNQRLRVSLAKEQAQCLKKDGWNVEHDLGGNFYLIFSINAKNPIEIPENPTMIVLESYRWRVGNQRGIKAYLSHAE